MSDTTTNTHKSSKAPAIATAVILGAIALTPVAVKSFGNNPEVAKIGNAKTTTSTASTATINEKSPDINKVGYSAGFVMGTNIKNDVPDLNTTDIQQGLADAYEGKKPALTQQQMEQAVTAYLKAQEAKIKQAQIADGAKNLQAGQAFLAENGKKAGIKTTASGLQYEVLKEGTGAKPKATDIVSVKYEGKTIDGKVFDSTEKHGGQPAEFPLNQVIPGWTEGVQLMSEGSKYRFYIPSNLAYGEQGMPPSIPGNSVLIFDVELVKVSPNTAKAEKAPSAEEQAAMQAKIQEIVQQAQAQQQNQGQTTTTTTQTTKTTTEPAK